MSGHKTGGTPAYIETAEKSAVNQRSITDRCPRCGHSNTVPLFNGPPNNDYSDDRRQCLECGTLYDTPSVPERLKTADVPTQMWVSCGYKARFGFDSSGRPIVGIAIPRRGTVILTKGDAEKILIGLKRLEGSP